MADELPRAAINAQELRLAHTLIQASDTDQIDLGKYKDVYTEKLTKLIEAKVAGAELVSPPPSQEVAVGNLMDALKESLARLQQAAPPVADRAGASSGKEPDAGRPRRRRAGRNAGAVAERSSKRPPLASNRVSDSQSVHA